jgi:hypothetical protein
MPRLNCVGVRVDTSTHIVAEYAKNQNFEYCALKIIENDTGTVAMTTPLSFNYCSSEKHKKQATKILFPFFQTIYQSLQRLTLLTMNYI